MSDFRFLLPAGLIALISVPLVVLFHMRSPTPRAVPVPALRFWRVAAPRPTDEPRFRRPPLTRSLVLHLLTALALSLALGGPASSAFAGTLGDTGEPTHLVILLDGSTSMLATDTGSDDSRFDEAKKVAISRINRLSGGDAATVLVMGKQTRSRSAGDAGGLRQLADFVRELDAPQGRADLTSALLLATDLRVPGMRNQILLLSDGALSVDPDAAKNLGIAIEEQRFGAPDTANVAIVGATLRNDPTKPAVQQMTAQLVNQSDEEATVTVQLSADNIRVSADEYTLPANSRQDLIFSLPSGTKLASMTITTPDAQAIDNTAVVPVGDAGASGLNVLIFSDHPDALARAFGALPGARITLKTTDAATEGMGTGGYDLVVYDQIAPTTMPISPALFIAPPDSSYFRSPEMLADAAITNSNASDPALASVDLSGVTFGVTPKYALPDGFQAVVSAADGALIARGTLAANQLPAALIATPLQNSNITERIAFPILIANLTQLLAPAPAQSVFLTGDPIPIQPHAGTQVVRITTPTGREEQMDVLASDPSSSLVYTNVQTPGAYVVKEVDGDGGIVSIRVFTVNGGDEIEANLRANPELADILATASGSDGATRGRDTLNNLWPVLALIALVLLTIESLAAARERVKPETKRVGAAA